MDLMKALTSQYMKPELPEMRVGDTVRVHQKITEGTRERIQVFEGTIIARKHGGIGETITVRRVSYGVSGSRPSGGEGGDRSPRQGPQSKAVLSAGSFRQGCQSQRKGLIPIPEQGRAAVGASLRVGCALPVAEEGTCRARKPKPYA